MLLEAPSGRRDRSRHRAHVARGRGAPPMIPRPTRPAVPFTLERAASRARSIERARGLRGPVERTGCVIHAPDRSEQDGKQREPRMSRTPTRPARARPPTR